MDVFAEHAIAGILGLFFNSLFGADYIISLDGVNSGLINGGFLNQNWKQMYIQLAYIIAVIAYSFVVSALLAFLINLIPSLHLRASEEAELLGMDDDQLGEFAYDYVEVRRDFLAWTPAHAEPIDGEPVMSNSDRHGISGHKALFSDGNENSSSDSDRHLPIAGDRHGIAAEKVMHPELHHGA